MSVAVRKVYSPQVRASWTETDWNWHIRYALQGEGYRTFHIREASETGVADLIVYHKEVDLRAGFAQESAVEVQVIDAWLELKKDNIESEIRPSQREFMRDHWRVGRNAMFVMYDRKVDMLAVRQGDLKGRMMMLNPDPYSVVWREVFAKFKSRKAMPL